MLKGLGFEGFVFPRDECSVGFVTPQLGVETCVGSPDLRGSLPSSW